jgi:hypothetical protein
MTIACPCCKASNTAATCRRCKADLSLLAGIEANRGFHIAVAKRFAADERWPEAERHLRRAGTLRTGFDVNGLLSAVLLHQGRYAEALATLPEGEPS